MSYGNPPHCQHPRQRLNYQCAAAENQWPLTHPEDEIKWMTRTALPINKGGGGDLIKKQTNANQR